MHIHNKGSSIFYSGFGVFATKDIKKNDFLLQFVGQKIDVTEAKERERKGSGSNMIYYLENGNTHW